MRISQYTLNTWCGRTRMVANLQLAFNTPATLSLTCLLLPALRNSYLGRYGLWGKESIDRSLKFKPCTTENRSCLQRDLYPHREDKWAVLTWSMLGKGGTSQKSRTGCITYLRSSRRYNHYCLVCVRKALIPYIVLNEKKNSVDFPLCNEGNLLSIGCCHSPVFRETKAILSVTSAPTTPA